MTEPDRLPLLNGTSIPRIGFGTWPLEGDVAHLRVSQALEVGYRLIDTSHKYGNEEPVGRAIRESGISRGDIFVTSKFNKEDHGVEAAQRAYGQSLKRTGLDYLDLFLIHWPNPWLDRYVDAWRGLIKLVEQGLVGAIGVSNFKPNHIDRLVAETGYVPDVNQIQLSVDLARPISWRYNLSRGILTEGWSPLGRGGPLLWDPTVLRVAADADRSPAQVLLRWQVQKEIVPIGRADKLEHLQQNLAIFDFSISDEDMTSLNALDRGEEAARDSDNPENGH